MKQVFSYIHPDAELASNVVVEPFVTIDKNVRIGAGTHIGSNVTILEGTTIGENCNIFPGAVIGAIPQDLKFRGEKTEVIIGNRCNIRECVTIHRGTASKNKTVIGDDCLIMAYCHVAHDCRLGNHIIMSNVTQLAGECVLDDWAIIGGGSLIHQFTHIGAHVMLQGGSRVNKDIPPYVLAGRDPISYAGINSVGLRRRGFNDEQIDTIQDIYRLIYNSGINVTEALQRIETEIPATKERDEVLLFIRNSARGILRGGHDK